jgi:hypothetical protein
LLQLFCWHCPLAPHTWQGGQASLQVPDAASHVWQAEHFGTQVLLAGLQTWQASQPPVHWPVLGLHCWQAGHAFGAQVPPAQLWQAGQ